MVNDLLRLKLAKFVKNGATSRDSKFLKYAKFLPDLFLGIEIQGLTHQVS
jgi:hypothetical protein